jgi:predicted ATP-grasp superfamily ATP-dependent carboligase
VSELSGVRVLVTDADARLGLYVIRALGRAGCRVTALTGSQAGPVLGFSSRFTAERHRLRPGRYEEVLADTIGELAPQHDVVVPVSTLSILLVALAADRLTPHIHFYIPPLESVRIAESKRETTRVGREIGMPVPETYDFLDPDRIESWVREEARGPLVIKFADDRRTGGWGPADRYRIVEAPDQVVAEYRRMHALGEFPVVQEYIGGDGYGFFAIMGPNGEPVATFCHKRLREYPISGGPSTLCESFYDDELVELGTRLLKALDWRGVGMVEFKQNRDTGEYKLLEINPRFWGSLPLAIHCGVDFPVYQVQLALGVDPQPPASYPVGRKMRYFFSDLFAVWDHWRSGNRGIAKTYARELLDWRIRDGLFELGDPRPMATYIRQMLRR